MGAYTASKVWAWVWRAVGTGIIMHVCGCVRNQVSVYSTWVIYGIWRMLSSNHTLVEGNQATAPLTISGLQKRVLTCSIALLLSFAVCLDWLHRRAEGWAEWFWHLRCHSESRCLWVLWDFLRSCIFVYYLHKKQPRHDQVERSDPKLCLFALQVW